MKKLIALWLLLAALTAASQDTVTVMTYNILNYGNFTSYCTMDNNSPFTKENYMKTLFSYTSPDILGVNEISGSGVAYAQRLLDSVLNVSFPGRYSRGTYFNTTGSSLANMLYYDSEKFAMKSQWAIDDGIRDICFFKLYYKSPDTATGDTVFLTCISMHLKAGSTSSDEADRASETLALMNHINSNNNTAGNVLVMGDFNVYSSNEDCFQNMINYPVSSVRFYDPINKLGNWSNNSSYANYHTQSTWVSGSDCAATGGMDDRFDFILINENIKYNTSGISYVPSSYKAIGQDGNRFNQSLSSPLNTSAPTEIIEALQNISDHLPVKLQLRINQSPASLLSHTDKPEMYPAYVGNNIWELPGIPSGKNLQVTLVDITGRTITSESIPGDRPFFSTGNIRSGIYIIYYSTHEQKFCFKIYKD